MAINLDVARSIATAKGVIRELGLKDAKLAEQFAACLSKNPEQAVAIAADANRALLNLTGRVTSNLRGSGIHGASPTAFPREWLSLNPEEGDERVVHFNRVTKDLQNGASKQALLSSPEFQRLPDETKAYLKDLVEDALFWIDLEKKPNSGDGFKFLAASYGLENAQAEANAKGLEGKDREKFLRPHQDLYTMFNPYSGNGRETQKAPELDS